MATNNGRNDSVGESGESQDRGRYEDRPRSQSTAGEEASRAAYKGAGGSAERAIEQPLPGARRCRYQ